MDELQQVARKLNADASVEVKPDSCFISFGIGTRRGIRLGYVWGEGKTLVRAVASVRRRLERETTRAKTLRTA